jgi:hypothetical protein
MTPRQQKRSDAAPEVTMRGGPRCPYCGTPRTCVNEYTPSTCGLSECQEADFHATTERNMFRRVVRRRRS